MTADCDICGHFHPMTVHPAATDTRNHDARPHEVTYPGMPIEAPLPFRGFRIVPGCHYWPDFCRCPFPCELELGQARHVLGMPDDPWELLRNLTLDGGPS